MHRRLFRLEGRKKILLTKREVAEFDQREVDAVERRRNQPAPAATIKERLKAVEDKLL